MKAINQKTHWLQSPNKNFLGHWDLPNGKDIIVTIDSAQWEEVRDPITKGVKAQRVIKFKENYKPLICNQTNAQAIIKSTKKNYMEDCVGERIKLSIGQTRVAGEMVDCLRVKTLSSEEMDEEVISPAQIEMLELAIKNAGKNIIEFCKSMRIESISKLPTVKYVKVLTRLNEIKIK